jgi:hypothetical protein
MDKRTGSEQGKLTARSRFAGVTRWVTVELFRITRGISNTPDAVPGERAWNFGISGQSGDCPNPTSLPSASW